MESKENSKRLVETLFFAGIAKINTRNCEFEITPTSVNITSSWNLNYLACLLRFISLRCRNAKDIRKLAPRWGGFRNANFTLNTFIS